MNKNSRILMNYHTIYAHAHGENNKKSYECAHGVGRLSFEALKFPIFCEVVNSPFY